MNEQYSALVEDIMTGDYSTKDLAKKYSKYFTFSKVAGICGEKGLVDYRRAKRQKFLDQIRPEALKLISQKLSDARIARKMGVAIYDICCIRREAGIEPIGNAVSPEYLETVRTMFNEGKSDEEIGAVLGKSFSAIRSFRDRHLIFNSKYNQTTMTKLKPFFEDPDNYALKVVDVARRAGINRGTVVKYLELYQKEKAAE